MNVLLVISAIMVSLVNGIMEYYYTDKALKVSEDNAGDLIGLVVDWLLGLLLLLILQLLLSIIFNRIMIEFLNKEKTLTHSGLLEIKF